MDDVDDDGSSSTLVGIYVSSLATCLLADLLTASSGLSGVQCLAGLPAGRRIVRRAAAARAARPQPGAALLHILRHRLVRRDPAGEHTQNFPMSLTISFQKVNGMSELGNIVPHQPQQTRYDSNSRLQHQLLTF